MKNSKFKYDFFICSSANDADFVKSWLNQLTDLNVFYPHIALNQATGDTCFDVRAEALENSKDLILVISPEAVRSKWVKIEYQTFFNSFYSEENNRRIHLLKGKNFSNELVPLFFKSFQIADSIDQIVSKALQSGQSEGLSTDMEAPAKPSKKLPDYQERKKVGMGLMALVIAMVILGIGGYAVFQGFYKQQSGLSPKPVFDRNTQSNAVIHLKPETSISSQQDEVMVGFEDEQPFKGGLEKDVDASGDFEEVYDVPVEPDIAQNDMRERMIYTEESNKNMQPDDFIKDLADVRVINFPNGNRYEGEHDNGMLHGKGVLHFAVRTLISKNDPLERYAEPGNYLVGEWSNGEFYMGRLHNSKGEMKERIIIGRK